MKTRARVHALLIGVDRYTKGPTGAPWFRELTGGVADVVAVAGYLAEVGIAERVTVLAEGPGAPAGARRPTYANVVRTWRRVMEEAGGGGHVYVHWSGHGVRVSSMAAEVKGYDEALVPCDVNEPEGRYLIDLEIAMLLREHAARGQTVTLVIDACHAGGVLETPAPPARAPTGAGLVATEVALRAIARELRDRRDGAGGWALGDAPGYTLLAACQPDEGANEVRIGGVGRGALTCAWLEALAECGSDASYAAVYPRIIAAVQARSREQMPALLGARDRPVFGRGDVAPIAGLAVREVSAAKLGGMVRLGGGAAVGVAVGREYAIVPLGGRVEGEALARLPCVRIAQVQPHFARAEIVRGDAAAIAAIAPGDRAVVVGEAARSTHVARWQRVLAMRHDATDVAVDAIAVELWTEPAGGGAVRVREPARLAEGTRFALHVQNQSGHELHVVVLALHPTWEVALVAPPGGDGVMLAPGEHWAPSAIATRPAGWSVDAPVIVRWKVIATRVPLDAGGVRALLLPPMTREPAPSFELETPRPPVLDRGAWIAIDVALEIVASETQIDVR